MDGRLVASGGGGHLAQLEHDRVLVYELPRMTPLAEVAIGGDDHDVAFSRTRLLVLVRHERDSSLHVVDPTGPTQLGEIKLRAGARIAAIVGDRVVVATPGAMSVVELDRAEPLVLALPLRGGVQAIGALDGTRFVVSVGGVLEEWDAATRTPGKRLRLGRAVDPKFVGGNDRRIWMIDRSDTPRVEVVQLAARTIGQIDLPEAPSRVVAHPSGDLLAVLGNDTRCPHIVYVDRPGQAPLRVDREVIDVAWLGRTDTLAMLNSDGRLELVSVPGYSDENAATPTAEPERAELPIAPSTPAASRDEPVEQPLRGELVERVHAGGWRGEVAAWSHAVCARSFLDPPTVACGVLDELCARLQLASAGRHALMLLYGAYLDGRDPVAPVELAAAVDWQWDTALGVGPLAACGAVRWRRGRISLFDEALAALDERPAIRGWVAEAGHAGDSSVAIVAPAEIQPRDLAAWAAPTVGALLVPDHRGERAPERFLLEAKLRGLVPLVPWARFGAALRVPPQPGAIVVGHASDAANLDLPVVATWSATTPVRS